MYKLYCFTLILVLFISTNVVNSTGSSAGDEGSPPPPPDSSSGASGGSPQFYDYYVPLVFNITHKHGLSEIIVWLVQPSLLITSFSINKAGQKQMEVSTPTKFTFNPIDNRGLTNGSLIRTTSPALVTGQRQTEDIYTDNSFAYSILSARMMGYEYKAPFDGWISLVTTSPSTTINIANPSKHARPWPISPGEITITLPVQEGAYINSTNPTNAAFISSEEGGSASMSVPGYLRGSYYIFDSNITSPRVDEIDHSLITVDPETPTELEFRYSNGEIDKKIIFEKEKFKLHPGLRSINSTRGDIVVNLAIKYKYAGLMRTSTIQLIAAPEMRAGELFATPKGYTSHLSAINNRTQFITGIYDYQSDQYSLSSRLIFNRSSSQTLSYNGIDDSHVTLANNKSAFGFLSSPGKLGHPMSPSLAFINIPLNAQTGDENVTGILSTWYRFPNLAAYKIQVIPATHEEYTGQTIILEVISNGSLPASRFNLEITLDDETIVDEDYDFLQVNETLRFEIRRFISFGVSEMNILIDVDTEDQVDEINEEDNQLSFGVKIEENIRLRWSVYGIIIIIFLIVAIRLRKLILASRRSTRAHVDAIISFEEENVE